MITTTTTTPNQLVFGDLFTMRQDYTVVRNASIERRLVASVREESRLIEGESSGKCLVWNKKSPFISVAGRITRCRKLVYDYCVDREGYDDIESSTWNFSKWEFCRPHPCRVQQVCPNDVVCVNPKHLYDILHKKNTTIIGDDDKNPFIHPPPLLIIEPILKYKKRPLLPKTTYYTAHEICRLFVPRQRKKKMVVVAKQIQDESTIPASAIEEAIIPTEEDDSHCKKLKKVHYNSIEMSHMFIIAKNNDPPVDDTRYKSIADIPIEEEEYEYIEGQDDYYYEEDEPIEPPPIIQTGNNNNTNYGTSDSDLSIVMGSDDEERDQELIPGSPHHPQQRYKQFKCTDNESNNDIWS